MNDLSQAKKLIKECLKTQNPYLDLGFCGITNLDDIPELFECVHLTTLILSNALNYENIKRRKPNKIVSISQKIVRLKNLQTLNIFDNRISDISFLKDLTKLNNLNLSYNRISKISALENLSNLNSLDLSENNISDISALKELTNLNSLSLWNNKISEIKDLKNLTNLNTLNLGGNEISDISFLKNLTNLNYLHLWGNKIYSISALKELTNLNSLNLSGNEISDISALKDLTNLNSLNLSENKISNISFLKDLTKLNTLNFNDNQISNIRALKDLTNLNSLNLSGNEISQLPVWITDFKMEILFDFHSSNSIILYNNPLQKPPLEIVEQGKGAIARYFAELEKEDVKELQLFEAKILLLGEGETGKTSLRNKLEDEDKPLPKDDGRTRGVDIYHHNFSLENNNPICHIWDFGGQDILYQIHRFFLSEDALYILVTDSRKDQGNKFEEWLQTIEIFSDKEDNQIILLQNLKYGDTPANIDIADFRNYYSIVNNKVFEVDLSLSGETRLQEFRDFKEIIKHRLCELPHIKKPILSHWLDIRNELDKLLSEGKNLITYPEYKNVCNKYKWFKIT